MNGIYLDNAATTRVFDAVQQLMMETMREQYGNPSSLHTKGVEAERYVRQARERIARTLKVSEKEIVFTSGGTESNNMALIGGAMANRRAGKRILTTAIEHASVSNPVRFLEEEGFDVVRLPVDGDGIVSMEALREAMTPDTIVVSVMYVNNEIGSVQPVEEISRIIKAVNPRVLFHVDAIQAYGKYEIRPKKMGIDLLSVSGHKIHGPKGVGFLYLAERAKVRPLLLGGGQQQGRRSGTENVPGIAGLGLAAEMVYENVREKAEQMAAMKAQFVQGVEAIPGTKINGKTGRDSAPHIVSVSFEGIRSEVLLHALEAKGIYVSAGSACSSNKSTVSATLKAIGLPGSLLDSTLRFSFGAFTTAQEISETLDVLAEVLPLLRRYARR